jgi:asparagine synthase (glutamine-hydrolysing)
MNGFLAVADSASGEFSLEESQGTTKSFSSSIQLVANARLDNRRELLTTLASWLPEQARPSDADLILAAYLCWGERCPEHLLGDFSFCLWDSGRRMLFCARDPLGVKPLHYARIGSLVCVSSKVGRILEHPSVHRRLDLVTLGDYLTESLGDPERTFFSEIRRLLPGHRMIASPAGFRLERYWDVSRIRQTVYRRDAEYSEHFLDLLQQAVGDRLATSAPTLGIALSGGLDSSAVAAVAQRELSQTGSTELLPVSLIFSRLAQCDERPFIEATVNALGLKPILIEAEPFWFLGDEEAYTPSLESPALSWEGCFQQVFSRLRSGGAQVLLTGHGADDLLRGSFRVYADRLRRADLRAVPEVWQYAWSEGRRWRTVYRCLAEPLLPPSVDRTFRQLLGRRSRPAIFSWISSGFAYRTGLAKRLEEARRSPRTAPQEIYDSIVAQPGYGRSIDWYDRTAAPFGVEVRHPFLDRRIAEYVLSIPPRQLFRLGTYKPLLRQAMCGLLPDSVRLRRDKTKLGSFIDYSLREKEGARVEELFRSPVSAELGILDGQNLREAFRSYRMGSPDGSKRPLWYAITVELWLRKYSHLLGEETQPETWAA